MVTTREEIATRVTAALLANPALDRQPDDHTIADAIALADLMIARLAATAPPVSRREVIEMLAADLGVKP